MQTITGAFTGGVARHISADSDSTGKPYVAFATGGNSGTLKVATWTNAGGSPSIQTADSSLSHALPSISITFDNIIHIFSIANSKVYETKKIGSTWQTPSYPLGTTFNSLDMLTSATSDSYALWKENSGPYDIRFGTTTPTDFRLESSGEQRVTYFDGTNIWRFFYDGTSQNIFYQYSSDNGVSWSSTSSTGSGALAANSYFSVFGEGNTVLVSGASLTKAFTIKGTITGTTIVWGSLVQVFAVSGTNAGQQYYPSFEKVGTSLFLGFNVITKGKNVGHVYKSTNLGTSWGASAEITLYTGETNPGIVGVTEYGSSNLIAVYARNADTEFQYRLRSSGGTWTGPFSTAGAGLATGLKTSAFSITSDGTCAWTGYVPNNSGGQLRAIQFCDSGGSLVHVVKQLTSGTNLYPTITSENGNIQLLYMQSGTVRAVTNFNIGSGDWQSEVRPFGYTFDNAAYLHAEKNLPGGSTSSVPVVWRERTAVPFAIKMSTTNPVNWLTHVEAGDDFLSEQQQIEPHIAASRSSTQQDTVVAGYIHYSPGPQCRVSRSTDSGATWQFGEYGGNENLPNGGHGFGGDPSSASSTDGTFYYACYGNNLTNDLQDPDPTDGTWKRIDTSSINFVKSTDNGLTWTDAATQIFRSNEQAQLDKPWIAVEWGAAGGSRVYACWNEFDYANHQTRIKFAQILPSFANEITIDSSTWSINGERRAGPYVLGCQLTTAFKFPMVMVREGSSAPHSLMTALDYTAVESYGPLPNINATGGSGQMSMSSLSAAATEQPYVAVYDYQAKQAVKKLRFTCNFDGMDPLKIQSDNHLTCTGASTVFTYDVPGEDWGYVATVTLKRDGYIRVGAEIWRSCEPAQSCRDLDPGEITRKWIKPYPLNIGHVSAITYVNIIMRFDQTTTKVTWEYAASGDAISGYKTYASYTHNDSHVHSVFQTGKLYSIPCLCNVKYFQVGITSKYNIGQSGWKVWIYDMAYSVTSTGGNTYLTDARSVQGDDSFWDWWARWGGAWYYKAKATQYDCAGNYPIRQVLLSYTSSVSVGNGVKFWVCS